MARCQTNRAHTHVCKYSQTITDAFEVLAMASPPGQSPQTKMALCQTGHMEPGRQPRTPTYNITKQHKNVATRALFAFAEGLWHKKNQHLEATVGGKCCSQYKDQIKGPASPLWPGREDE